MVKQVKNPGVDPRDLWLAGLGVVSLTRKQAAKVYGTLVEEGTQFRTLLNETRRDLAMAYIRDTELAFGEIAYLLGFASAEAFQRAFKRWSGQTPGEFRRGQRLQPS